MNEVDIGEMRFMVVGEKILNFLDGLLVVFCIVVEYEVLNFILVGRVLLSVENL